jgi:hypothetical protein
MYKIIKNNKIILKIETYADNQLNNFYELTYINSYSLKWNLERTLFYYIMLSINNEIENFPLFLRNIIPDLGYNYLYNKVLTQLKYTKEIYETYIKNYTFTNKSIEIYETYNKLLMQDFYDTKDTKDTKDKKDTKDTNEIFNEMLYYLKSKI